MKKYHITAALCLTQGRAITRMFQSAHWARAFINSVEKEGGDIEEGIEELKVLASWVKKLTGEVFGSLAAKKTETLVRNAVSETAFLSPALETAIRFLVLMVKRNKIRYLDSVIIEAKKLLNKKRGIVAVSVECAFPLDEAVETRIKEEIKKHSGATGVELTEQHRQELIGGYRLRIEDEIIDASVSSQLKRLESRLAYGGNN